VLDEAVGAEVAYTLPNGKEMRVRILDAQPFTG
jgi:hypothetical protein